MSWADIELVSFKNRKANGFLALVILVILIAAVAVGLVFSSYIQSYTVTGTVKAKWVDVGPEGSYYLVRLTDGRMLEVERNLWYYGSEYNPDRIFSEIEIGKTYRFTCWGWQLDFWTIYWYPNIIRIEEVKQ